MTLPWYWPLIQDLRKHIEDNHQDMEFAMDEVDYSEEYLHYESYRDGEDVVLTCPWSIHCKCTWKTRGEIKFEFKPQRSVLLHV